MSNTSNAVLAIARWTFLVALFVLANAIGNASPYLYLLALLIALPFLLADPKARAAMNRWESYGYAAAFLCIAIAYVFAKGGWSNFSNLGNFLPYLLFIPALGLLDGGSKPSNTARVATLALIGATIAAAVASYEKFALNHDRVVGFINTTNPFAMASVMLGFLSLMGFLALKDRRRYLFCLGPVLGTYAAILAETRAVMLIVLALCVVFAVCVGIQLSKRGRLVLLLTSLVGVLAGTAILLQLGATVRAFSAIESVQHFLTEGAAIDHSVAIRLELYRGGIMAFLDAPIFGYGSRHHVEAARPFMEPGIAAEVAGWSHLHNDYINFAALAGIFGLVSYGLYLLIPIVSTWKSVRDSQYQARCYGGWVVTVCYAVYGLFGSAFAAELLLAFGAMCTATLLSFCKDERAVPLATS